MIKTELELIQSITEGKSVEIRSHNVELKENWKQEDGKKISSISNQVGAQGWLVVGVADNGILKNNSYSWAKTTEQQISNHIREYLDPIQSVEYIRSHQINNLWFVVIKFHNPGAVVYWNRDAYMPVGTHKEIMENEDILALTIKLPGLNDYSKQICEGNPQIDDLLIKMYARKLIDLRGDKITSIYGDTEDKIINGIGLRNKNAGKILFGNTKFRVILYALDGEVLYNESYSGLFRLINGEVFFDVSNKFNEGKIIWEYGDKEIRESFGNAVAHAAYFENGGEISVEIYYNKIYVSNLCLPESGAFANKWLSRDHKSYNLFLAELLRLGQYIDELGLGKGSIYCESIKRGGRPPIIDIELAGSRYKRWKLSLFSRDGEQKFIQIYEKIQSQYSPDERKALIALSLIYWEGRSSDELIKIFDSHSLQVYQEIVRDPLGPVYLDTERNIQKSRWVRCLQLGQSSMGLSEAEKIKFWDFISKWAVSNNSSIFTTKFVRRCLGAHESNAETTMISNLTSEWVRMGWVKRIKQGTFQVMIPVQ